MRPGLLARLVRPLQAASSTFPRVHSAWLLLLDDALRYAGVGAGGGGGGGGGSMVVDDVKWTAKSVAMARRLDGGG